jgi:class 3 adenylate cyclase
VDARPSFTDLGGKRQEVSVLHADVRGYSTLAESAEPEEVMRLLLAYHGAAVAALRSEGATVDRFVGDAVLALWNAPAPQEQHARMALKGALALLTAAAETGTELRYGVGVHSGPAIVGNLGSDQLMTYTAVGDTVNVAARLQSGAPAGEVICSAATLAAAGDGVRAISLGALSVKGRTGSIDAYRVEAVE